MTGSMGGTSLAEGLLRVTPPCCLQSAMRGGRSTRWCTRAPPSPMPSRISGATSSSGSERSMSTSTGCRRRGRTRARHLRCGRRSGRSRRRGGKAPGPRGRPGPSRRARAARGSPPTPPQFHGRTTGLSRIPRGWRTTAEIITSTTSARDRLPGQEGWVGV